ncbi:hypothetical protein D3C75_1091950 [compost metagenome]
MNIRHRAADRLAVKLRHRYHRRIVVREQVVGIAVGNKQRIAAVKRKACPAAHAQNCRAAADKVKLSLAGDITTGHAKRRAGFDASVSNARQAHAAQ